MLDSICTVTTAAASRLLSTLATVRAECGVTDGSDDANLKRWLSQASSKVEAHTRRTLVRESFRESFKPVTGLPDFLSLLHYPKVSITSVTEDDAVLATTDYEVDPDTGSVYRLISNHRVPWFGFSVVIDYDAGYTPGTDLLPDLERAAIVLVKQYRFAQIRDPLASNVDISGSGATRYFGGVQDPNGLSPEVDGLIAPYKI